MKTNLITHNSNTYVLLVEDEPELRELLSSELEINGYHVVSASGGQEAYKIFSEKNFDLVISDLKMGSGSGIDLLRSIRDKSAAKTPVILMSGYSEFDEKDVRNLGAQQILNKPFSLQYFVEVVVKTLEAKP